MSTLVSIIDSIIRFRVRYGEPPTYVEISTSEMDDLKKETQELNRLASAFQPVYCAFKSEEICGVPIRERKTITFKDYVERFTRCRIASRQWIEEQEEWEKLWGFDECTSSTSR